MTSNNFQRYIAWKGGQVRRAVHHHVSRMLSCRTAKLGLHLFGCSNCPTVKVVPHSCKSVFCSSCGKVRTDQWCDELLSDLLEVPYRHLVFTLPWELRLLIQDNRRVLLNVLFRAAADAVLSLSGQGPTPRGRKSQPWLAARRPSRRYLPGLIIVLHTFGSDLKWNPHLHMIVTAGGLNGAGDRWQAAPPAGYGVEVERPPRSAPRSPVPAPGASPASKRPPTPDRGGQALGAHSQEALAHPHRSVVEKCRPSCPLRLPLYQAARHSRRAHYQVRSGPRDLSFQRLSSGPEDPSPKTPRVDLH